ncbi:hypothetical protein ASG73_02215 [Janibacter sp. Soil728]|uniref:DoxX family membrane protein n=1 Tax=Janibacter sp. Soil728 TaxID=1736393 RepID=UPI00070114B5|nr:DoxX family membrane protein [Janibacter sp. Soil728]KRE39179.1 hypothetical protein ASG73_02215 [Janibacter sp. Soil728]
MSTTAAPQSPSSHATSTTAISPKGAERAFLLLRTVFTIAPIVFGLDKFANVLTDWPAYLAPWIDNIVPGDAQQAMYIVGVIEIVAGIVVATRPRWGALLVSAWLVGIIINLLTYSGFYDVALRDFGLLVAALSLYVLATPDRITARAATDRGPSA